jgi:hypothetical protein
MSRSSVLALPTPTSFQMKEVEIMRHMLLANNMSSPQAWLSDLCHICSTVTLSQRRRMPNKTRASMRWLLWQCYLISPLSELFRDDLYLVCDFPEISGGKLGVRESLNDDLRKLFEPLFVGVRCILQNSVVFQSDYCSNARIGMPSIMIRIVARRPDLFSCVDTSPTGKLICNGDSWRDAIRALLFETLSGSSTGNSPTLN